MPQFTLDHLDDLALKHVASTMGLEAHAERSKLLRDIGQHLTSKLDYTWAAKLLPSAQPLAVYGFSIVAYNHDLYLFGGRAGVLEAVDQGNRELLCYSNTNRSWEAVEPTHGDMPVARRWHTAVVVGNQMIVLGGQLWGGTEWEATNSMISFCFDSRRWSTVEQGGMVPSPRYRHCCTVLHDTMYMLPGEGNQPTIYAFNTTTNMWTLKACTGDAPNLKSVEAITSWADKIYALVADEDLGTIQVYCLDVRAGHHNEWAKVSAKGPVPLARRQCCCVSTDTTWILSGGATIGGEERVVSNDMWAFDFPSASWHQIKLQDNVQPARASHGGVCLPDGSVVIIGGWHQAWPVPSAGIILSKQYLTPDAQPTPPSNPLQLLPSTSRTLPVPNTELCRSLQAFGATCSQGTGGGTRPAGAFTDVVLVPSSGREVPAHRVILASQSDVFDTMFRSEMKEGSTGRVELPDISEEVLLALLEYLYGGLDTLTAAIIVDLFGASDRFNIQGLKQECILRMAHCMEAETVALVAQLAALHGLQDLWTACVEFTALAEHQSQVFGSRAFASMWEEGSRKVAQDFTTQVSSCTAKYVASLKSQLAEGGYEGGVGKRPRTGLAFGQVAARLD